MNPKFHMLIKKHVYIIKYFIDYREKFQEDQETFQEHLFLRNYLRYDGYSGRSQVEMQ